MIFEERRKEGSAAVMAVTAAPSRKEPGYVDVEQGKILRQALAGMEINLLICKQTFIVPGQSTGITYSLLRTMFRRARAADSMARGSLRSRSTSVFND